MYVCMGIYVYMYMYVCVCVCVNIRDQYGSYRTSRIDSIDVN